MAVNIEAFAKTGIDFELCGYGLAHCIDIAKAGGAVTESTYADGAMEGFKHILSNQRWQFLIAMQQFTKEGK